jgi:hypothetical protein
MRAAFRLPAIMVLPLLWFGPVAMGISATAQAAVSDVWPWQTRPAKPEPDGGPAPRVPVTQGDTVQDPFALPAIPCTVTGNTCAFNDDYDEMCPYGGGGADVVYRYDCATSIAVRIDLCASTYDTKVYVCEDTVYDRIACNDDYCAYQSLVRAVPFAAGHTYFIVVDGYGSSCGDYVMEIEEHVPCVLECPPGAMPEGEPDCYENYNDIYNNGCACYPDFCFQYLEPACDPIVICGTNGVFAFDSLLYRDTDWYEIDLTEPSNICLAGDAEVPSYFFIVDGRGGCAAYEVVAYGIAGECAPVADICYDCDPGTWWLWVGPTSWDPDFACGSKYVMEVTGYTNGVTPAQGATWGRVKGLFR